MRMNLVFRLYAPLEGSWMRNSLSLSLSLCLQSLCTAQNVNCRDLEGRHSTPLHFAAGYNRVAVVEYLLHHGADVHAKDKGCDAHTCSTFPHCLRQGRANVRGFRFCSGLVPLHNACSYGHYEVAELLVRHGASVNVADLWKFTPLHEAAAKGKYEICKLLLKVGASCPRFVLQDAG